ncbi:MAG: prepilin-type N-terminal cleavage/methylation domain-containing protein [Sideroxydans sp.]|nr:prepilin-type N-terminal cleavage/methylation domain-containing protein [Sideroxydans sp.]
MLIQRSHERGFSLVELLVGISIFSILIAMAAPSFTSWVQNAQLRTAAESISAGLQLARAEAVRRNTNVMFQLTDSMDAACNLSLNGPNWVVSLNDTTALCHIAPSADTAAPVVPSIIQKHSGTDGTPNAIINADVNVVTYGGLGRVNGIIAPVVIRVTNPTGGDCRDAGGPMRCLNIIVSPGGQSRMCDPAIAAPNPQGC